MLELQWSLFDMIFHSVLFDIGYKICLGKDLSKLKADIFVTISRTELIVMFLVGYEGTDRPNSRLILLEANRKLFTAQ